MTFDIDANGILSASAKDKGTGKEQRIVIQSSSGLEKDEVDRMVNEAQQFAEEDKRKRTEAETRNQADSLVYSTEKLLSEQGENVPAELKQDVEEKVQRLKTAVQSNDVAAMQTGITELNASLQALGQARIQLIRSISRRRPPRRRPRRRRSTRRHGRRGIQGAVISDVEFAARQTLRGLGGAAKKERHVK